MEVQITTPNTFFSTQMSTFVLSVLALSRHHVPDGHSMLHHVSHNQSSVRGIFFLFFFFLFLFFLFFVSPPGLERAFHGKAQKASSCLFTQGTRLPLKSALKGMLPCTAGCAEDCLMILDQCPIPAGGTLCSGVGWCLSTQGICQCYLGYAGDDCSSCDEGYVRYGPALLPCTHLAAVRLIVLFSEWRLLESGRDYAT